MLMPSYHIPCLPPLVDLETKPILKALVEANRVLAELKGRAAAIPNQGILIDTLSLQEAKASSEVENIVTTQDELFQAELFPDYFQSAAAKEVALYRDALKLGFDRLISTKLITNATLIEMFQLLKRRSEGYRATPGTALKNDRSGELVYIPPQDARDIAAYMGQLEAFINDNELCSLDPLIKMALIHHQFESIHPFSDGNGRIGRILNVLYLTKCGLLDIPILYLSRHITRTKGEYYRLLQHVRDAGEWEAWVLYMLEAVRVTSGATLILVEDIRVHMQLLKHSIRERMPRIYSQDLINNLVRHPYTKIEYLMNDIGVTRQTASKYLDSLADAGFITKHVAGRNNYYINRELVSLLVRGDSGLADR